MTSASWPPDQLNIWSAGHGWCADVGFHLQICTQPQFPPKSGNLHFKRSNIYSIKHYCNSDSHACSCRLWRLQEFETSVVLLLKHTFSHGLNLTFRSLIAVLAWRTSASVSCTWRNYSPGCLELQTGQVIQNLQPCSSHQWSSWSCSLQIELSSLSCLSSRALLSGGSLSCSSNTVSKTMVHSLNAGLWVISC